MSEIDISQSTLNLPWHVLISISFGYLSYNISYAGIKHHHKQVDVAFISISYGIISWFSIIVMSATGLFESVFISLAITLTAAISWRYIGIKVFYRILRRFDLSWSDNAPSAWSTITSSNVPLSQIAVRLNDGSWLRCEDTLLYEKLPFGPCQLGPNGDVALYLTHQETADGECKETTSTLDDYWGSRMTYVPASQIQRVTLRYKQKASRLSKGVLEDGLSRLYQ